ncbi:endoplasmin [Tanacetum coccineum]
MSICVRGVGYEKEDLIKNLGITMFGTLGIVPDQLKICDDLNLIVQFGVGFYLESKADGVFAISKDTFNELLGRGTGIRLQP